MPGHLVDVFLHIERIDVVLNARVHNLLRLSDRPLDDLLSERKARGINGLQHNTLLNPVLWTHLGGIHQFLSNLRNWNFSNTLHNPLLDTVLGNGLRQFYQLLDRLRHRNAKNPLYPARFGLGLESSANENLLDNLRQLDVPDLFTSSLRDPSSCDVWTSGTCRCNSTNIRQKLADTCLCLHTAAPCPVFVQRPRPPAVSRAAARWSQ